MHFLSNFRRGHRCIVCCHCNNDSSITSPVHGRAWRVTLLALLLKALKARADSSLLSMDGHTQWTCDTWQALASSHSALISPMARCQRLFTYMRKTTHQALWHVWKRRRSLFQGLTASQSTWWPLSIEWEIKGSVSLDAIWVYTRKSRLSHLSLYCFPGNV